MARTDLPVTQVPADYAVHGAAVTFTVADVANGNRFRATGREVLLVKNTGAGAATVTVASAPDAAGRSGDVSADSVAAGASAVYQMFPLAGWADGSDYINVNGSSTDISFAVLRIP